MTPKTEIILDMLTNTSVSILKKQYFDIDGERFYTNNIRNAYENSPSGRTLIKESLPEGYYKAVIAVWGDTPTVDYPIEESEETNE